MKNESKTFEYILMIEICRLLNEIFNHVQYLNGVDFRKKEIFLPLHNPTASDRKIPFRLTV